MLLYLNTTYSMWLIILNLVYFENQILIIMIILTNWTHGDVRVGAYEQPHLNIGWRTITEQGVMGLVGSINDKLKLTSNWYEAYSNNREIENLIVRALFLEFWLLAIVIGFW